MDTTSIISSSFDLQTANSDTAQNTSVTSSVGDTTSATGSTPSKAHTSSSSASSAPALPSRVNENLNNSVRLYVGEKQADSKNVVLANETVAYWCENYVIGMNTEYFGKGD